jgi:DegV family protein with EDD domain
MSVRIVTDSGCDLPEEIIRQYGITVVPFYINVGAKSYLDGVEMSRADFYQGLPHFDHQPTTSVPGPGVMVELYRRLAAEGATGILAIHISSALSAMTNTARLAAEEYDGVPVEIFDSGNLTLGTGLQVLTAAKAVARGHTLGEILELLADQADRTYCFAALDTLEYLRRSGRLSRFQWGLGSVLQVRPILKMNAGEVDMERVRTQHRALARVIELVEELGPLEELAVVHTHTLDRAQALKQEAAPLFEGQHPALFAEVTPVIGAHIGPGAAGFVAIKDRS